MPYTAGAHIKRIKVSSGFKLVKTKVKIGADEEALVLSTLLFKCLKDDVMAA